MNTGDKALILVKKLVKKIGAKEACVRLSSHTGVGTSVADKLARGAYHHTPGHDITDAIIVECERDGIFLSDIE